MKTLPYPSPEEGTAAIDVLRERYRQISEEGFTFAHDDQHINSALISAAACYAAPFLMHFADYSGRAVPVYWPFAAEAWKPGDRRRNLIKAAALIIAEIERLDRAAAQAQALHAGTTSA